MPFWVVSGVVNGVGRVMGALDGGPCALRRRGVLGGFVSIGLNGVFFNRNVFGSCMKS